MAKQTKPSKTGEPGADIAAQLEQAFLAGLGVLAHARKAGSETFESLVAKGKSFRGKASGDTAGMIRDIQLVIRGVASNAEARASGIVDQVRDKPKFEEIQRVVQSRLGVALEKVGGATRAGFDEMHQKLDRVLKAVEESGRAAKAQKPAAAGKKAAKKRAAGKKKTAKKPRKKATRKSPRKAATRKPAKGKK